VQLSAEISRRFWAASNHERDGAADAGRGMEALFMPAPDTPVSGAPARSHLCEKPPRRPARAGHRRRGTNLHPHAGRRIHHRVFGDGPPSAVCPKSGGSAVGAL